jgi:hypothetical protein
VGGSTLQIDPCQTVIPTVDFRRTFVAEHLFGE